MKFKEIFWKVSTFLVMLMVILSTNPLINITGTVLMAAIIVSEFLSERLVKTLKEKVKILEDDNEYLREKLDL